MIKLDSKSRKVTLMGLTHIANQGFFASPLASGANHDCRTVGIISTDVDAAIPPHFLKPNPNISLDIFDQVPDVNWAIGVGKRAGDEKFTCHE